ncbi:MAG: hypothetical protein LBU83_00470, partial [Bacteroidales bacterium]|nr:hypothetical protein [Bacteroidales bacterium]
MTIKSFTRLVGAAVVVMVCWIGAAQAQEDEDVFSNNMTLAALINVFHFEDGNNVWSALLTTSVSAGIGYHFNIIPNTFSPGIYVDAGVSLLQLI